MFVMLKYFVSWGNSLSMSTTTVSASRGLGVAVVVVVFLLVVFGFLLIVGRCLDQWSSY